MDDTRYFVYIDHMNHADSHIGRKKFVSFEEAWLGCPKNYCIALGSWDDLVVYFGLPNRMKKGTKGDSDGTE